MRALAVALAVLAAAAGCASPAAAPSPEEGYAMPLDPMDATPRTQASSGAFLGSFGDALLSIPETALWIPYKVAASALSGAYQGAADGIAAAPLPVVGVLLSPVTAGAGAVSGAFQGLTAGPWYLGNSYEFGRALGQPFNQPPSSPWAPTR